MKIAKAILVLAIALSYTYCADRTHIFNKSKKQFSLFEFTGLSLLTVALGFLSIRRSTISTFRPSTQSLSDQPFLSRDQTDEWKGWMQFAILIYHYTGASRVLEIYKIIRVLVAAYLFMTGFGHTIYFLQRANYSLHRFASVLIRINLLSCILPYIMNTDYLFYYFSPLITFWYVIIYVTTKIGHSNNASSTFLISKIIVAAMCTSVMIHTPGCFEAIFSFLRKIFKIRWDVAEWRFRLQLDAYVVYVGMMCSILYLRLSSAFAREPTKSRIFFLLRKYWTLIRLIAVTLSLLILFVFFKIAKHFSTKSSYNRWITYMSPPTIMAYITLRNSTSFARNRYSYIFAWLGRHSLETFTLQFHTWLAGDTQGLLALGVFGRKPTFIDGRWADFVLLTVVFIWMSWHVAVATATLTSWIVDPSEGREEIDVVEAGDKTRLQLGKGTPHLNGLRKEDLAGDLWRRQRRSPSKLLIEDLRVRLAVILGLMWFLNLVSRRHLSLSLNWGFPLTILMCRRTEEMIFALPNCLGCNFFSGRNLLTVYTSMAPR